MTGNTDAARKGNGPLRKSAEDFKELGLNPEKIEMFEDGMRAKDPYALGTWEWWYMDCALDDGNHITIVFKMANIFMPSGLVPQIEVNFSMKDGSSSFTNLPFQSGQLRQSRDKCDVRIANNFFRGDLNKYEIHVEARTDNDKKIIVDLELESTCESWRPQTGQFIGNTAQTIDGEVPHFNWICPMPGAKVKARYQIGDQKYQSSGSGYHDHNWGNTPMQSVCEQWFWGHGNIGPYTLVAYPIQHRKELGGEWTNVFMLAKNGKIVADNLSKVTFEKIGEQTVPGSDLKLPQELKFTYEDGDTRYVSEWKSYKASLLVNSLYDTPLGDKEKWRRNEANYTRFVSTMTLEKFSRGKSVEKHEAKDAMWEYMGFGHWAD